MHQGAVGRPVSASAGGVGGARHRGPVAAIADAVTYTAPAAARHGGYLGHARRQVGRRVDQQRVGALPMAGAAERCRCAGHEGQRRVQHQREHRVPPVRRRRARIRLRD